MKILKKHSEINKKPGSQSFINQEKVIKKTTLNGYNTCQNMKSMMMKNLYSGGIAEKLFTHIYQNWQGNSYAFKASVNSEQVFSKQGIIIEDLRCRLSGKKHKCLYFWLEI